jgi:hypothetical protein
MNVKVFCIMTLYSLVKTHQHFDGTAASIIVVEEWTGNLATWLSEGLDSVEVA